jgi:hypothetical protein
MSIEFHCPKCGKAIKAPDEGGGKTGKCPACHQPVYIPMPESEIEPLSLTPLDPTEEQERERLLEEARRLRWATLQERNTAPETADAAPAGDDAPLIRPDMDTLVVQYVLSAAESDMNSMTDIEGELRKNWQAASEVMDRVLADELLPRQLADRKIPRQFVVGLFRTLRKGK